MSDFSSKYGRIIALGTFLALAVGVAAAALVPFGPRYTIYAGDETITVRGSFDSVEAVLAAAGITLGPADAVSPPKTRSPQSGAAIQVQRAGAVTVRVEGTTTQYRTLQKNLASFLAEIGLEVRPSDELWVDGRSVPFEKLSQTPVPSELVIGRSHTVHIYDGSDFITFRTTAETVGQALQEAGLEIYDADGAEPPLGSWLGGDATIQVRRAIPLEILADGQILQIRSHHQVVREVLTDSGIGLIGQDFTRPSLSATLHPGDVIEVVRVTEDFLIEDEAIPFETLWQPSDQLELDQKALLSPGQPGVLRHRIRIRYENGAEVSREPDGDWVAREPVNEVRGYGTRPVVRLLETPDGAYEYWRVLRMRVTSYTASSSGKPPDHPAYGVTASGVRAGTGIVAVDRSVVPFRSWVYVPGYGVGFAGDTGGGIKGRWIDLGYNESDFVHWSGYVDVYFLTPVPPPEKIPYLVPDWLP